MTRIDTTTTSEDSTALAIDLTLTQTRCAWGEGGEQQGAVVCWCVRACVCGACFQRKLVFCTPARPLDHWNVMRTVTAASCDVTVLLLCRTMRMR